MKSEISGRRVILPHGLKRVTCPHARTCARGQPCSTRVTLQPSAAARQASSTPIGPPPSTRTRFSFVFAPCCNDASCSDMLWFE